MNLEIGNGGIFTKLYEKYGTLEGHVEFIAEVLHYTNPADYFERENIFHWNSDRGYHSPITNTFKNHTMLFKFSEPFYLENYRTLLKSGFRYASKFFVKTSYKGSPFETVYYHDSKLCDATTTNSNCDTLTVKYFSIPRNKIRLCDQIQLVLDGPDSLNTYCIAFHGLEFYGYYRKNKTCMISRSAKNNLLMFLFITYS